MFNKQISVNIDTSKMGTVYSSPPEHGSWLQPCLSGNLGERQKQLNTKVNAAAANNVNFDNVRAETEKSDVDKLFKIDLALKYENIDYILETLKSGDDLFISKALKCIWLCNDEFSDVINPHYLHNEIFPWMSLKMKKKFLTAVSMDLKDENRAKMFYDYCMSRKLVNVAFKYLIYSPESFKLHIIEEHVETIRLKGVKYLRFFIGNSFPLAECYLKTLDEGYRNKELPKLRYLYSVSNTQYLDLFEKYANIYVSYELDLFGLRLSKDIMTKNKDRVLDNPRFYTYFIKEDIIAQYSRREDVEYYLYALLTDYTYSFYFWEYKFWEVKYIIGLIPREERFEFIKRIFNETYPGEEFETSEEFRIHEFHTLFTPEQLEVWALNNLVSEEISKDEVDDYVWYKYLTFETAFEGINKLLMKTTDLEKRALTIESLMGLAKTHFQLVKLFEYYYEMITKEPISYSECFVFKVTNSNIHSVYDFDEVCWSLFSKICNSEKSCNVKGHMCNCSYYYEIVELIYNIIHDKDIPRDTRQLTYSLFFSSVRSFSEGISEERREKVYQYLVNYYTDEIKNLDKEESYDSIRKECRRYIGWILEIMRLYGKTKDDCPNIVKKYVELDWDWYSDEKLFHVEPEELTEKDLIHFLKQNAQLVVDKLPEVKDKIEHDFRYKINRLLRKLRTYYSNDIAKNYLDMYLDMLSVPKLYLAYAQAAVYGLLLLADDNYCTQFMLSHVPADFKINRKLINPNKYHMELAICRNTCYSRSSTVQSNILNFIKGDYVLYCTPILNSYLINLPIILQENFIKNIVEASLSDPKHNLRLALQCYTIKNLNTLALNIWNTTNDVCIRRFLYKTFFNRLQNEIESAQIELFETLKLFTQDLRKDDESEVFELLVSNTIPSDFLAEYLVVGWKALVKLSDSEIYCTRLIQCLDSHISVLPQDFVRSIVNEHIQCMIVENQFRVKRENEEVDKLINAKWELTANYIVCVRCQEELDEKLEIINLILNKCLEMWNDTQNDKYALREFFLNFIDTTLETKSYEHDVKCFSYANNIFELILNGLQEALPVHEIYIIIWKLRTSIITRAVLTKAKLKLLEAGSDDKKISALKEAGANFATSLGYLIKEFVDKDMYFSHMQRDIWIAVILKIMTVYDYNLKYYDAYEFVYDDVKVLVGERLIEFEMKETFMVTAMILEYTYWTGQCKQEYEKVVEKLKSLEDNDLKTYIYDKFA